MSQTAWQNTAFAQKFGLEYPIVQGPFGGGISSVELTSCVSRRGGLGSFGANALSPEQISKVIDDIRRTLANKPFAINLWVAADLDPPFTLENWRRSIDALRPYFLELGIQAPEDTLRPKAHPDYTLQIEAVLEARPPIVSFVFGAPSATIAGACRDRKILMMGTATTLEEAVYLEQSGVSAVIASGFEAGGHRASFLKAPEASLMSTMSLVPQIVDAVQVPVVAAGGIADGRGIAAALSLGASGVQIGTAFLACDESNAPQIHKDQLFQKEALSTGLSRTLSGRLVRAMRNRIFEELNSRSEQLAGYPEQNQLTGLLRKAAIEQGRADLMSLQAGQVTPLIQHRSAETLFTSLVEQTTQIFSRPLA